MTISEEKRLRPSGSADRTEARSAQSNARRGARPGVLHGWWRPVIWLAVCGGIVGLAYRSWRHSDVLVFYTRGGNVQGMGSHRARFVFALSNLSLGPEKGLTAEFASLTPTEGEERFEDVYRRWDRRREFAGFGGAMSGRGDLVGDATHVALVVPHWSLAALALLPVARWTVGAVRRWRRTRRTGERFCWNCGYPLVHATDRCPECGEAVDAALRQQPVEQLPKASWR